MFAKRESPLPGNGVQGLLLFILLLAFSPVSQAAPMTVQSVLFDCDGDVLTYGPKFGPTGSCDTDPITGNPPVDTFITNGDFLILQTEPDPVLGDGIDEMTKGLFDLQTDVPAFTFFKNMLALPQGKIVVAELQLVLTPKDALISTDTIELGSLGFIGSPNPIQDLKVGDITKIVTIDLLDYYTPIQLENTFFQGAPTGNEGRILFRYSDDAIVSGAKLKMTALVPEPGTLLLFSLGGLLLLLLSRLGKGERDALQA